MNMIVDEVTNEVVLIYQRRKKQVKIIYITQEGIDVATPHKTKKKNMITLKFNVRIVK